MKITRQPLILATSLVAALALSACGKSGESDSPIPAVPPPSATVMMPAPPAPAASTTTSMLGAPAPLGFRSMELGSTVDANHRILASGSTFAPKDSIYAAVDTSGSGSAMLAARWTYQDGRIVHEDSKTISATGPQTTTFMISKPSGFAAGDYKVGISLDGKPVASKDFSVK